MIPCKNHCAALAFVAFVGACAVAPSDPRDDFVNACVSAGDAMLATRSLYLQGKVSNNDYDNARTVFAAVVKTCAAPLPADVTSQELATREILNLLGYLSPAQLPSDVPSPL